MSESKKLGELVVIAIRAKNLATRDIIGKGDPFVTFRIGEEAKRIKAEKKGGQHPEWDEEVRFDLVDNPNNKKMKIQVLNEDKREHILIGDSFIDLSQVLENGEWDDWHEIKYRNKYAGEVFLEMTFYYADAPPPQKQLQAQHQRPQPTSAPPSIPFQPPPPQPNSYGPSATPYPPVVTNQPPMSAPSAVGYPPQNVYPSSPPLSQPPQFFGPQRTQSPVSSQYPPVSTSVYPPQAQASQVPNVYPTQQARVYPQMGGAYPPISSPPESGNLAFPVPVPTPGGASPFGGPYPSYNAYPPSSDFNASPQPPSSGGYQQSPYPPNNAYPPSSGGSTYPPPPQNTYSQGYPYPPNPNPNPYPPNGPY
ncbi:11751_t:CDS:2 [Funneliformis mosseae]|uniref:11751_t:CDS:1 n=1 Tax=Funneliformis mosseae TaxID=27381 RepID=A0A9N9AND8_FUNMO|nr:11751_t:CDS:2 [Funneliformis mosseae]